MKSACVISDWKHHNTYKMIQENQHKHPRKLERILKIFRAKQIWISIGNHTGKLNTFFENSLQLSLCNLTFNIEVLIIDQTNFSFHTKKMNQHRWADFKFQKLISNNSKNHYDQKCVSKQTEPDFSIILVFLHKFTNKNVSNKKMVQLELNKFIILRVHQNTEI